MSAENAALNRSLREQRGIFLVFVVVELLAAAFSLHLSMQAGGHGEAHYQLQLIITAMVVAMLGLCAFIEVSEAARPTIMAVGAAVFALYFSRVAYAIFVCAHEAELGLPPIFIHGVTAIVFPFAILRLRHATWLSAGAVVSFALLFGAGAAFGGIDLQSAHAVEILQQTLFVNPALLLLLRLSIEVQARLQEQALMSSQDRTLPVAPAESQSPATSVLQSGVLTAREFVRATRRLGAQLHQQDSTTVVAVLDLLATQLRRPGNTPQSPSSLSASRFLHLRLRELFGSAALIGQLSKSRFAIACETADIDSLMDRLIDFASEQNGYGQEARKRVALGLVEYRVGESVHTTLERAERAVERAKPDQSTGVSYSSADFTEM